MVPQKAYKFLSAKYANRAQALGEFRLSPLSYFRGVERGPRSIGDEMEGSAVNQLKGPMSAADPGLNERLAPLRIEVGEVETFDLTITHSIANDPIILCFASTPDVPELNDSTYDALLEITDIVQFAEALTKDNLQVLGEAYGAGLVQYRPRAADLFKEPAIRGDALIKGEHYAFQKELRLFWPEAPAASMPFNIVSPRATAWVRRVR